MRYWYRFCDWVKYTPKKIKWFIQRGRNGFATEDTWDFHNYLSKVIYKGLEQFKKETCAWPGTEKIATPEIWDEILDKIIFAFKMTHYMDDYLWAENFNLDTMKIEGNPVVNNTSETIKNRLSLVEPRIDEGMQLFIKHFNRLWW
jgi:hypothetical protein